MMKKLVNGKKIIQIWHMNNKSKWANAVVTVDGVESYFVWIPRYAYKITYNEDKTGGTIDVKFLVGTSDNYYDENGELQKAKRAVTGHEDTTSDYYVHPAFTNDVDLGGWDSELTGIWVGKYETSLIDTSDKENITNVVTNDEGTGNILLSEVENRAIAVQEGMSSWRCCTIGNMYTNAKSYDEDLNSHMLKNSEWGAVAYLTHSQYGRNGGKVLRSNEDNYSKFITADKGISVNPEQSTTKNEYGVYDIAGGGYEYVASWYGKSTSQDWASYGSNLINEKEEEFITIYAGETENMDYKIGDATYETKNWAMNGVNVSSFINSYSPAFLRGGTGNDTSTFAYDRNYGRCNNAFSFRMCLVI